MCVPPKITFEKAEHKKFSVREFWDEHFGEDGDDESSDDEGSSDDGNGSDDENRLYDETRLYDENEIRLYDEDPLDYNYSSDDEDSSPDGERPDDETLEDKPESDKSGFEQGDAIVEDPPLQLNYDALKHIANHFLPGSHGACVDITSLEQDWYHEFRLLHFEDGWSCLGRFARDPKDKILEQVESSLATMEYVRSHTDIPVPEVYFVNHDKNHVVGSAFVLMEHMPGNGETLIDVWDDLASNQKLGLVGDIASIVGQLADLHFDHIGCLTHDGSVGPLLGIRGEARKLGDHPVSTMEEYMSAYINENDPNRSEDVRAYYPAIKAELRAFLSIDSHNPTLRAPYRLIHGGFESYNILVERNKDTNSVRITGVTNWDFSRTGPMYQLCEYPQFIRDHDGEAANFASNKTLRKHFVSSLAKYFPRGSTDRALVRQSFREKNFALNHLHDIFMYRTSYSQFEEAIVKGYLDSLRGEGLEEMRRAYGGVWDWQPDSEDERDWRDW